MLALDLAENTAARLGIAAGIVVGAIVVGSIVGRVLRPVLTRRKTPSFGQVFGKLIGWAIAIVGIVAATTVAFPSVKPVDLIAGAGVFSIALGFAFQDILSNLLAGLLLIVREPFHGGDQIEVNGHAGTVEGITIRETTIKTFDGKRVIIPNADVYQSAIEVQTAFGQRRTNLVIGVGYEDDVDEAEAAILAACRSVDEVHDDPPPEAYLIELGDNAVVFDLRYWHATHQADARRIEHLVFRAVKNALDEAGIDMPFPVRTIEAGASLAAVLRPPVDESIGGTVEADEPDEPDDRSGGK